MTDDLVTEAREMVRHGARPLWQDTSRVLSGMADRIEELEAKLEKAQGALGFYAEDEHWNPTYADPGMSPFSAAEEDEGKTARAVLAELEEKRHA